MASLAVDGIGLEAEQPRAKFGPENPFFKASELPFGVPPFDRISDADYGPAFEAGMAQQTEEVLAIAQNVDAATFANTVAAMEKTGALLDRVGSAFGAIAGAYTNPAIEQLQQDLAPKWAAHEDAIYLNEQLFARIESLYEQRGSLGLDAESARLLDIYYERFVHAGAKLNGQDKARLMELNSEESTLTNGFNRKLLAATKAGALLVTDAADLAGMSEAEIAGAAAAAKAREKDGFAIALHNTTQQPTLSKLAVRATRQALFEASWNRTERGDENDLRTTVTRLAQLRAEKGKLLGFESYAAWTLDNQMAKTPRAAIEFMDRLAPGAAALAAGEQREIQKLIDASGEGFTAQAWDWDFYSEKVRKAKYDMDEAEVKPYFELESVLKNGVFYAATRLYGITFAERNDLPLYAPDVKTYEVSNEDGTHLAIFYCDWLKRDNKRGGAWMSGFVHQSKLLGTEPVIYNVCNFAKPAEGQPALISYDDVRTMFHEFGHALHGMFSAVMYPSLSGTSVPRDFVEFPSQFNEHWMTHPEVFANFAKHHETGEPMPAELVEKLMRAENFNQGYALTEVLAAAELDMEWHTLGVDAGVEDTDPFERAALERKGLLMEAVPPRYRSTYFAHVFGGGYAAGYYAYLWAELLDAAGYEWFTRNGGLTRPNGDRLREMVLSRGNAEDLKDMYERWYGGEPEIGAMLRGRGLV